jgi:hypothetical protein
MTYDDDFVRLPTLVAGDVDIQLVRLDLEWPPPERLVFSGLVYARESYSEITDEQRAEMTHVVRGAQYVYVGLDPDYKGDGDAR